KKAAIVAPPQPQVGVPVAPPPAAPAPAPKRSPVPIVVAGGLTAALTIGAVATGIAAHVDYSQYLRENITPPTTPLKQRESLRSQGMAKAWASTALTIGAI